MPKTPYMINFDTERDVDFLRASVNVMLRRIKEFEEEIVELRILAKKEAQIKELLSEELLLLKKKIFDAKSERSQKKKLKTKKPKVRLVHNEPEIAVEPEPYSMLGSEEIIHSIDSTTEDASNLICSCGCGTLEPLENCYEESSEIDVIKTQYVVTSHKRQKYKCKSCSKIVTAPGPQKLTPGAEFSTHIAVQIVDDKYHRHLPLNRQAEIMAENGLQVDSKTLYTLSNHLMVLLSGLDQEILREIKTYAHLHIDETRMPLLKEEQNGYVWSVNNAHGVYYQYEVTRAQKVAAEMLRGFKGVVVSDAYAGYEFLNDEENIIHALCLAHARRKFVDAQINHPKSLEAVEIIDTLYHIEHEAKNLEELAKLRVEKSQPQMQKLYDWIDQQKGFYLESSLLGKAINYFKNNQIGLVSFLTNALIPIDNNSGERSLRSVVMGRKNFQGFRTINGADVAMFFYTLIGSCKLLKLNPKAYLTEMSSRALRKEKVLTPLQFCKEMKSKIVIDPKIEELKRVFSQ